MVGVLQLASQKLSFNTDEASLAEVLAGEVGQLTPGKPVVELGVTRAGGGYPDRRKELATSPGCPRQMAHRSIRSPDWRNSQRLA